VSLRRPAPSTPTETSPGPAPQAPLQTLKPPSNRLVLANAGIKGFAAALALALQIVLVKLLGESDYGAYVLFVSFCFMLSILGKGGLDISTLRYFAVARDTCEPSGLRSVRSRTLLYVTLYSLVAIGLGQLFRLVPGLQFEFGKWGTLAWMVPVVLTFSLLIVVSGMLRGVHRVLLAESLDSVARPLVLLLVAALGTYVFALDGLNTGLTAFVASNILVGIAMLIPFNRSIARAMAKDPFRTPPSPFRPKAALVLSAAGLLSYGLFQLDTLLVGVFLGPESVASYAMACNYARIVVFTSLIISAQSQPLLAAAFGSGTPETLRRITLVAIRNSVAAAVAGLLVLVVFGRPLLRAVSVDFETAYPALLVLGAAYLVNSATIILSATLLMCRREAVVMWAQLIGLAVCAPLLLLLVPRLGQVGAAVAVLASTVVVIILVAVRGRDLFQRVLL
jgi:O-antigen/teichoic acid export membrane protein